ncbi:MAG: nuclear transport factor 2 family protein [Terriglobales bacterium]
MRHVMIDASVLVTCLTAVFTVVTTAAPKAVGTGAEEIVRKLSNEESAAFLRRDSKALARLWSDDLVVTNPLNKFVNKHQVLEMIRSGFLVITSYSRHVEYAQSYGDIVILAGAVWGGRMPNAGQSEKLRFTAIWRNENGTWREIARHANIVREAPQ